MRDIDVDIRRSARRKKTIALQVRDGKVRVSAPMHTPQSEIVAFLERQRGWVLRQLARSKPQENLLDLPDSLWVAGQEYRLIRAEVVAPEIQEATLRVPETTQDMNSLRPWLMQQAQDYLPRRLEYWARQMGLRFRGVEVKHYRSRYGCCTREGIIKLHWGLIMAPAAALDYVLIHELSHLVHFHHQPPFWALVSQYSPQWRRMRAWFKANGQRLVF
ncbi:M48 family metallopeptidase [Pokkaliibacter sp. CJK22405]|uniref:M48 family metallopeptidase n=1 Tax=Pokkaliibacter sp. CJK22405 TaxID=3384615 RepID=UPI003984EA48